MKKIVVVILAVVMCLSFAGCDGGSKKMYEVGDTVSTDCAQLTLNSFEIVDEYDSLTKVYGKKFAVLTFSVKNIGKTNLGFIKTIDGNRRSYSFSSMPCIDYNDGYLFSYESMLGGCSINMDLADLAPLSDVTVEVVILVPPEVKENEYNPLLVKMAVPKTNGSKVFTYKIR